MNPKENVSAITLRGGKQLEEVHKRVIEASNEESEKRNLPGVLDEATSPIEVGEQPKKMPITEVQPVVPALPFPSWFSKSKKEESKRSWIPFVRFKSISPYLMQLSKCQDMPNFSRSYVPTGVRLRVMKRLECGKMCLQCFNGNSLRSVRI